MLHGVHGDSPSVAGNTEMSQTFAVQGCPICGRRLQIRTQFLGRRVQCTHCGGSFRSRIESDAFPAMSVERSERLVRERLEDELPVLPR
jgi:stress-induced morphogen